MSIFFKQFLLSYGLIHNMQSFSVISRQKWATKTIVFIDYLRNVRFWLQMFIFTIFAFLTCHSFCGMQDCQSGHHQSYYSCDDHIMITPDVSDCVIHSVTRGVLGPKTHVNQHTLSPGILSYSCYISQIVSCLVDYTYM